MRKILLAATAFAAPFALAHPAFAAPGDPVKVSDTVTFDPIIEGRLRYESVDTPTLEADAVTMRMRAGAELKIGGGLSFLAEGEGTLAISEDYNAFPFPIASSQRRPAFAVVPDAMNVELNRLQMQYRNKAMTLTLGRQRINLDDQRFVGSVGWRQNEQTFDAVRAEAKIGPVAFDGTYAISQRTILGDDAGPRQSYDGNFLLLAAGAKLGPVNAKAFAYLLDYDEAFFLANSSATYGVRLTAALPVSPKVKVNLVASYARQCDYKSNPFDYSADYIAAEAALATGDLTATIGYELLGSDSGRGFQTPLATLHKFNGWSDIFLTTPTSGLQDLYGGLAYKFGGITALSGLNAAVTWHRFESDVGSLHFGDEWDASLGFKLGRVTLMAKYADFQAKAPGFVDTRKFWLQAEFAY